MSFFPPAVARQQEAHDIGEKFYLSTHLAGVSAPDNSGSAKYIELTANKAGAGQYNEGLLVDEDISGSAPLLVATAEIAVGPLAGQVIHLINTEEAVIRARETSGELQFDQMQRITGSLGEGSNRVLSRTGAPLPSDGALIASEYTAGNYTSGNSGGHDQIDFNSASSPNARASSTTSGETRAKNVSATAYMRIA